MTTDKLILHGCHFFCRIGEEAAERSVPQIIMLDIQLFFDIKKAAASDDLADTIDYRAIHTLVKSHLDAHEYHLIETLAEKIAALLLEKFPTEKIFLRLKKPGSMRRHDIAWAGLEITRS